MYPDGHCKSYKTYLMIMEDGKQVVPKVPNSKVGQESQDQPTNASEVATMEFGKLTTYCDQ